MNVWTIVKTMVPRCCGRLEALLPEAKGITASGHPQHRGAIVLTIV